VRNNEKSVWNRFLKRYRRHSDRMHIQQFWHILETDFEYNSPHTYRLLVNHLPAWATVIFYLQLLRAILRDSHYLKTKPYDDTAWASGSFEVIKIVESAGGKFHISGLMAAANYQGPLIYIANHMSLIDPLVLPCILLALNRVSFVVKRDLLKHPIFGPIARATSHIAVSRKNPRKDLKAVFSQGEDFISQGYSIAMFPQATRSVVFDSSSFNSLGIKLAQRTHAPVVPIALKTDFQNNGRIFKDLGAVNPKKNLYLKFGEPIFIQDNGQKAHQKVVRFISENLKNWGVDVR
jgi:1-acyl-sn-glycerol-3-phosphate acyltransferase